MTKGLIGVVSPVSNKCTKLQLDLIPEKRIKIPHHDLTQYMLERAGKIAFKKSFNATQKFYLQVLKETKYPIFKGAPNTKIIFWIKISRSKLNGNDIYRTIEMDNTLKVLILTYFFFSSILYS